MSKPLKILLAEDNDNSRRALEMLLQQYFPDKNVLVFPTDSLQVALRLAHARGPFKLGLIDLELKDAAPDQTMPVMRKLNCETVIAMSGVASGEARKQVRSMGADDYLEKPIVADLFIDKVATALAKGDDDSGQFAEVQHRAQRRLQEKVVAPVQPTPGMLKRYSKEILVTVAILGLAIPQVKVWALGYTDSKTESVQVKADVKQILEKVNSIASKQEFTDARLTATEKATDMRINANEKIDQESKDDRTSIRLMVNDNKADTNRRLDNIEGKIDQLLGLRPRR